MACGNPKCICTNCLNKDCCCDGTKQCLCVPEDKTCCCDK